MKKLLISLAIIVLIAIGGYFFLSNEAPPEKITESELEEKTPSTPEVLIPEVLLENNSQPTQQGIGLNIEELQVGQTFGAWTVVKNNVEFLNEKSSIFPDITLKGLDGAIVFSGSLEISGSYVKDALHGSVITLDEGYASDFPQFFDKRANFQSEPVQKINITKSPQGSTLRDACIESTGQVRAIISNLIYSQVTCEACDAWEGFLAEVTEEISATADPIDPDSPYYDLCT